MLRTIFIFGLAAGLLVAIPMFTLLATGGAEGWSGSAFTGYLIMLLALSLIFVGVKRRRDRELGGVIRFLPAFLTGLGISAVAGIVYVTGWEITLALTDYAFVDQYVAAQTETARARGASAADLEKLSTQMASFRRDYMNPLIRLPMSFAEIFPVGLLVSLISAALLRNSRFLPARAG